MAQHAESPFTDLSQFLVQPQVTRLKRMPLLIASLVGGLAGLLTADETLPKNPWLALAAIIIGSGIVTEVYRRVERKRSGEGPAVAAEKLAEAAGEVGKAATLLTGPLERTNSQLQANVNLLQARLATNAEERVNLVKRATEAEAKCEILKAEARQEEHSHAQEIALLATHIADRDLTIEELTKQIEDLGNLRTEERRSADGGEQSAQ